MYENLGNSVLNVIISKLTYLVFSVMFASFCVLLEPF